MTPDLYQTALESFRVFKATTEIYIKALEEYVVTLQKKLDRADKQ